MQVVILGKTGCGKCAAAKEKLERMGFAYTYVAIDDPEGWRECNAQDALAAAVMEGIDHTREIPILFIDGKPLLYAAAMKELKARMK